MFLTWMLRNWKLIAAISAALALLFAGIWFRGVLADRAELSRQNQSQAQELVNLSGEIERMNRQDAQDHALMENIEAQKKILAAEQKKLTADLRKLREKFDAKTTDCFNRPLPAEYLDRLLSEAGD